MGYLPRLPETATNSESRQDAPHKAAVAPESRRLMIIDDLPDNPRSFPGAEAGDEEGYTYR